MLREAADTLPERLGPGLLNTMIFYDLSLPSPEANLACDEALLDWCEQSPAREVLRCWEPATVFLVLGYANRAAEEALIENCRADRVPVLRRCSGGGCVLQGPGCLNYSLVLQLNSRTELQTITGTNRFIMERHRSVLSALLGQSIMVQGCTDLTWENLKFSGNAQRRKRCCLLFHGTFLLHFNLALVDRYLALPRRQPTYRAGRSHREFLTRLPLRPEEVKNALQKAWLASETAPAWPEEMALKLARTKYASAAWNGLR